MNRLNEYTFDMCKSIFPDHRCNFQPTFSCRWNELVRKIELWAEIHELNEQGTYSPVELQTRDATECGGIFQLRQGFSRRIVVQVTVPKQGQLPVVLERIKGIAIGSVKVRVKIQKGLDSYQERDLQRFEIVNPYNI